MKTTDKPLIVIVGETASGKSSLAMKVAINFEGEIVCADSRTVYKEMNIGTAKPSVEDQKKVKHHGLSVVSVDEDFTAADFKYLADDIIDNIKFRKKVPIMVGGTGLYVDGVLYNYSFSTKANAKFRSRMDSKTNEELREIAQNQGLEITENMLKNRRHLLRLLERGEAPEHEKIVSPNTLIVGIKLSRSRLRHNIVSRTEAMFKSGLRREVDGLVDKFGWQHEALSGIGYREFKDWYDGKVSMSQVKKNIVQNTLKYAKRQRTWFKKNIHTKWFEDEESAFKYISSYLNEYNK